MVKGLSKAQLSFATLRQRLQWWNFKIPPFASCSPDTFAKIWPKFSERSKIEIVTGEHDVERGGTKLATSERESKAENYST